MKPLRSVIEIVLFNLSVASSLEARQLECRHDYTTHLTVIQITEIPMDTSLLDARFYHEISPVGGEENYIFDVSPTSANTESGYFNLISDSLFYSADNYVDAISFISFEQAILKEFQFPRQAMEDASDALTSPIVTWDCRRTD
jgi:hypothetical protein